MKNLLKNSVVWIISLLFVVGITHGQALVNTPNLDEEGQDIFSSVSETSFSLIELIEEVSASGTVNPSTNTTNTAVNNTVTRPTTGTNTNSSSGLFSFVAGGVAQTLSGLATIFVKLLAGILFFVLYWMDSLMDNTFILEGEIGEKIRSVWVIVRNFVNIFFALMLVGVALVNVVGAADEGSNYSIKRFIPKMALALIAVNFTLLAGTVVLDVNNVLTTAIFDIPRSVTSFGDYSASNTGQQRMFKRMKCFDSQESISQALQRTENLRKRYPGVITQLGGVCFALDYRGRNTLNEPDSNSQEIVLMGAGQFDKKNFAWTMATQFQGLHDLNKVSSLVDDYQNLTINALFSVLFAIAYATAYVAMFIILLVRVAVLWVCLMLSPLVVLNLVVPDLIPEKLNIQSMFLQHAFVPAKMAIPLAFGYIMISQMVAVLGVDSTIVQDQFIDLSQGGELIRGGSIVTLLYGAISLVVVWMGVFTASEDVIGSGVINSMKEFIQNQGKELAKYPLYTQVIPDISGGGPTSLAAYYGAYKQLRDQRNEESRKESQELAKRLFPSDELKQAIKNIQALEKGEVPLRATQALRDFKTVADTGNVSAFQTQLKKVLSNPSLDPTEKKQLARGISGDVSTEVNNFVKRLDSTAYTRSVMDNFNRRATVAAPEQVPLYSSNRIKNDVAQNLNKTYTLSTPSSGVKAVLHNRFSVTETDLAKSTVELGLNTADNPDAIVELFRVLTEEESKAFIEQGVLEDISNKSKVFRDELLRDDNFKSLLVERFKKDKDGKIEEAEVRRKLVQFLGKGDEKVGEKLLEELEQETFKKSS